MSEHAILGGRGQRTVVGNVLDFGSTRTLYCVVCDLLVAWRCNVELGVIPLIVTSVSTANMIDAASTRLMPDRIHGKVPSETDSAPGGLLM